MLKIVPMGSTGRSVFLALFLCLLAPALRAQLPFYTDDTEVTPPHVLHVEFFDEVDALQSEQLPDLRQNTFNVKINTGLPHRLELDFDAPYLTIYRTSQTPSSRGIGDADMGIKWKFHAQKPGSYVPAFAASLYIEFPTGDTKNGLGSGLHDYWLNFIAQERFTDKTRLTVNTGIVFAGNTSTGAVGIQTRGRVFAGGISLLHDLTPKLTLGGELYGGDSSNEGLARSQLQTMLGAQYTIRSGMTLGFGLIVGKYVASPRIGGQIGLSLDFPNVFRSAAHESGNF